MFLESSMSRSAHRRTGDSKDDMKLPKNRSDNVIAQQQNAFERVYISAQISEPSWQLQEKLDLHILLTYSQGEICDLQKTMGFHSQLQFVPVIAQLHSQDTVLLSWWAGTIFQNCPGVWLI